jgi:crossover junction endodeoxyribonuclease RuvC
MMVRTLLNLREEPRPHDAADALAIALCHAFNGKGFPRPQLR